MMIYYYNTDWYFVQVFFVNSFCFRGICRFPRVTRIRKELCLLSTFFYAFEAVVPLVLLIFLGVFFRKIGFFSEEFLSKGYSFSFRVALPCMLFCNVYTIENLGKIDFRTVLYAMLIVLLCFLLGCVASVLFIKDPRRRGVVTQCFFRSNCAVVGISLTEALGGTAALQCAAVVTAFTIPLFNIFAVIALTIFASDPIDGKRGLRSVNFGRIGKKILTNPLIIGVGLGLLALVIRHFLPLNPEGEKIFLLSRELSVIYKVVENLGKIASPFMMLLLGGQFSFSAVKSLKKEIAIGVAGRVLLSPILAFGLGYLLTKTGVIALGVPEYAAFMAVFATPVAVSSAIMAREMGNDDILAGQLVVWTSIASVFTIFFFAMAFRTVGLL